MSVRGLAGLALLLLASAAGGAEPGAPATLDQLLQQVRQSRLEETRRNAEREHKFLAERDLQQRRLAEAEAALEAEQRRSEALQRTFDANEATTEALGAKLRERSGTLLELFGIARQTAGQAAARFADSLISSQIGGRGALLQRLARGDEVPTMRELEDLWFALQQEISESGKVVSYPARVVSDDGGGHHRQVTRVGPFNATVDGSFLRYLPESGLLQELPRQPAARYRRMARDLEQGSSGMLPMVVDPSRGGVLALRVQVPDLVERVQQGRLVGYVIIGIAVVGLLLGSVRLLHLLVVGRRIGGQLRSELPDRNNPLGRVMAVYRENQGADTETLELKLDASILRDTPSLQRGLHTLRILAVIAPLLGLLGTVTGLIETFQAITLFGAGDPRLMAGGISQALITTVLGLITAIGLLLLHSALASKSSRLVTLLDQQSAGIMAMHAEARLRRVAFA